MDGVGDDALEDDADVGLDEEEDASPSLKTLPVFRKYSSSEVSVCSGREVNIFILFIDARSLCLVVILGFGIRLVLL